jgi:uncharacterized iron-regulated membrane protein
MNEAYLRKWHRRLGIGFAVFIFLQTLSGLILNLEDLVDIAAVTRWSSVLHRGGGEFGTVYRSLLGLGLLGMAASGSLIFHKIRQRSQKP